MNSANKPQKNETERNKDGGEGTTGERQGINVEERKLKEITGYMIFYVAFSSAKKKYIDGRNLERRGVKMWNEEADVECGNKRTIENSLVPSLSDLSARNKNWDHTGTLRSAPIIFNKSRREGA